MLGKLLRGLSAIIVILNAWNTGIMGLTNHKQNLIMKFSGGETSSLPRILYIVIGVAGFILFLSLLSCCKNKCSSKGCCGTSQDS